MGFTRIIPSPRVKPGMFRVSTVQRGRSDAAPWCMQISIPSAEFHLSFGEARTFSILLGDGHDAGKMMIQPDKDGAFKPTILKSCALFRLPPLDTTPQIKFEGENPERRIKDGAMIVELPSWAWEPGRWQAIRDAREIARKQDAAEKMTRKDVLQRVGQIKG